jgi:hypothetical protein
MRLSAELIRLRYRLRSRFYLAGTSEFGDAFTCCPFLATPKTCGTTSSRSTCNLDRALANAVLTDWVEVFRTCVRLCSSVGLKVSHLAFTYKPRSLPRV